MGITLYPGPSSAPWEGDGGQRRGGESQSRSSQKLPAARASQLPPRQLGQWFLVWLGEGKQLSNRAVW